MDNHVSFTNDEQNEVLQEQPKGYSNLANFFIVFSILSACFTIIRDIVISTVDIAKFVMIYRLGYILSYILIVCVPYIFIRIKVKKSDNELSLKILDFFVLVFIIQYSLYLCELPLNYSTSILFYHTSYNWNFIITAFLLFFFEINIIKKKICEFTILYAAIYFLRFLFGYLFFTMNLNYGFLGRNAYYIFKILDVIIAYGGIFLFAFFLKNIKINHLNQENSKAKKSVIFEKNDIKKTGAFLIIFSCIGISAGIFMSIYWRYFFVKEFDTFFAKRDVVCIIVALLSLFAYYFLRKKLILVNNKKTSLDSVFFIIIIALATQLYIFTPIPTMMFYIIFTILSCFVILFTAVFTKNKLLFIAPVLLLALTFSSGYLVEKLNPQHTAKSIIVYSDYLIRNSRYATTKNIVECVLSFAGLAFLGVYLIKKSKKMTDIQVDRIAPQKETASQPEILNTSDDKLVNFLNDDT